MDSRRPEPGTFTNSGALTGKRTLILSGDARERDRLERILTDWGMRTWTTASPLKALALISDAAAPEPGFDLVLFSPRGHRVLGEQFASLIRSEAQLQSLALVHVGRPAGPAHEAALRKAGFAGLVATPLDKTLLFDALHRACGAGPTGPGVIRLLDRYAALGPSMPPLNILLAEPAEDQRRAVRSTLARGGHRVFEVDNGEQALEALSGHAFDLVLIALDLPGIGGAETVRLFHFSRAREDWPPFIALANRPGTLDVRSCQRAEVAAILHKPVQPQALLQTLTQVMRGGDPMGEPGSGDGAAGPGSRTTLPLVDESALAELERLGSGPDFLSGLMREFVAEIGDLLQRTRESRATEHCYPHFLQLGHALKDSAGNLGALRLYQLGLTASHLPERVFEREGEQLLSRIEEAFGETRAFFRRYLERSGLSLYPR
jgi:two-component system sensor histidine kinase RpfC